MPTKIRVLAEKQEFALTFVYGEVPKMTALDRSFSATFSQECNLHLVHNWLFVEHGARAPAFSPPQSMLMVNRAVLGF